MGGVLFRDLRLLDTRAMALREGIEVLVDGATVAEVGPAPLQAPDAEVVDLGGRTLMPGLIDAHVHVTAVDVNLGALQSLPPSLITAKAGRILEGMLRRASRRCATPAAPTTASPRRCGRACSPARASSSPAGR